MGPRRVTKVRAGPRNWLPTWLPSLADRGPNQAREVQGIACHCPLRVLPSLTQGAQAGAMPASRQGRCVSLETAAAHRAALLAWVTRQQQALLSLDIVCDSGLASELRALGLSVISPQPNAAPMGQLLFAVVLRHPLDAVTPPEEAFLAEADSQGTPVVADIATADLVLARVRRDGNLVQVVAAA